MLTCFTQQLLYHKEKCSFLAWQSYTEPSSPHNCPSHFSSPSCLLWHSWAELTNTLWGKSVLPPLLNRSRQCKHSHSSRCLWMCMHCVHKHSLFKGTRTKCKLSAAIQQAESCQRSFWQPTGGTWQLQQEDTRRCFSWKSESVLQTGHLQDAPVLSHSLCTFIANCQSGVGLKTW